MRHCNGRGKKVYIPYTLRTAVALNLIRVDFNHICKGQNKTLFHLLCQFFKGLPMLFVDFRKRFSKPLFTATLPNRGYNEALAVCRNLKRRAHILFTNIKYRLIYFSWRAVSM